jgi:hypothetical protein
MSKPYWQDQAEYEIGIIKDPKLLHLIVEDIKVIDDPCFLYYFYLRYRIVVDLIKKHERLYHSHIHEPKKKKLEILIKALKKKCEDMEWTWSSGTDLYQESLPLQLASASTTTFHR